MEKKGKLSSPMTNATAWSIACWFVALHNLELGNYGLGFTMMIIAITYIVFY